MSIMFRVTKHIFPILDRGLRASVKTMSNIRILLCQRKDLKDLKTSVPYYMEAEIALPAQSQCHLLNIFLAMITCNRLGRKYSVYLTRQSATLEAFVGCFFWRTGGFFFSFFFLTYLAFTIFPALNSTISSNPTANMSGGLLSSSVEKGEKSHKSYYFVVSSNDLFSNFCQRSFL